MTSKAFQERLARRARSANLTIAAPVAERLEAYFRLLARWNAKVNLTSLPLEQPTDDSVDRLLIEPLAAARAVDEAWTPWIDVGSGGGSPAIPLKLTRPALALTMVESRARKAAFLREAVRELGLEGAAVESTRFEELARPDFGAGMVTLRAVRLQPKLVSSLAQVLRPSGRLLTFQATPAADRLYGFSPGTATVLLPGHVRPAYLVTHVRVSTHGH